MNIGTDLRIFVVKRKKNNVTYSKKIIESLMYILTLSLTPLFLRIIILSNFWYIFYNKSYYLLYLKYYEITFSSFKDWFNKNDTNNNIVVGV